MSQMSDDLDLPWPAEPLTTERLTVRPTGLADRSALLELRCDPEVRRHLGGPVDRAVADSELTDEVLTRSGSFAVEVGGAVVGTVSLTWRSPDRPGHVDGPAAEVSYALLPSAWGRGYATEAVTAVLGWLEAVRQDLSVLLCTQVANRASVRLAERLDFFETERFEEFGAEQWFGVRMARVLGDPAGAHWMSYVPLAGTHHEDEEPPHVEGPEIRFSWDYSVRVPLWADGALLPEEPGWLVEALGLSEDLIADLTRWGDAMNALDARRWSPRTRRAFQDLDAEARVLVERLRSEVDARYVVTYEPW